MLSRSASMTVERPVTLTQPQPVGDGSPVWAFAPAAANFSRHDLPARFFSQLSSVVSSGNLPLDRLRVHLPIQPTAVPTAFAMLDSHFSVAFPAGMVPASSPPNGVPAIATETPAASTIPLPRAKI